MEISSVGVCSKTKSLDPEKVFKSEEVEVTKNKTDGKFEGWLGNGEADETKKRKDAVNIEEAGERKKFKRNIGIEDDDNTQRDTSPVGVGHKINGFDIVGSNNICDDGVIIPKRPRGSFGRSKFSKNHLLKPLTVSGGSVESDELKHEVSSDSLETFTQQTDKLTVRSDKRKNKGTVVSKANKKRESTAVNGDLVEPIGSMGSKDQVTKLNDDTGTFDSPGVSSKSTSVETMGKLNGKLKDKTRSIVKKKGIVGNQKLEEESAAYGSSHLEKGEGADLVLNDKDSASKRNGSNRRKRKMSASSSENTVAKKVESSINNKVDTLDVDPDDDLEQNAARMLSSRFDPSCTGFSSTNRTLALLSANDESFLEEPTANVDIEGADRVLRPRRHQKGKGTSRKRRHFYDIHSDDMDAHWFLNRKIKIFWPLDESWYYGLVDDYDAEKNLHHIKYDDRDEEWIRLENERFKLLLLPSEVPHKPNNIDNQSEGTHKEDSNEDNGSKQAFMATHMESEPIISWLPRSSHLVNSSSSTSLKKKKISHFPSNNSLDVHKPSCSSAFLDVSIGDKKKETFVQESIDSNGGHLPIVYVRKRYRSVTDVAPCSLNSTSVFKLDTTIINDKKFEICISLWPMLKYLLGVDISWLLHDILLLQHGMIVTMWPTVDLEVLFVDNVVGLRLYLFEGCLNKAVAFVFLVMKSFCEPEKNESLNQQIPVTSIRFKLSFFKNLKKQKVSAYYSFSKVREFNWKYLDSELQPHCLFSKQLPLSECTYDNIKLLEAGTHHSLVPYSGETAPRQVFRKKSNTVAVPLLSSSRLSASVPGIRPSTIYSLRQGNLPTFSLSFTAAPNFFLGLHLKLLLEHSISLQEHAVDDYNHVDDHYESSSETTSKSHEDATSNVNVGPVESSELVLNENHADKSVVSSYKYEGDNQLSPQVDLPKDIAGPSHLKGLSVEIPTPDEICRDFQKTPGSQQGSELTWNVNNGVIYTPNSKGSRSLWHQSKSSPFGDPLHPWANRKADFIGNGFGNGPKKPRTQVQYSLPSREIINFKNKGQTQSGLPYQRIRKAHDNKKTFDASKGPRRNLEMVACDANLLVNSAVIGWRERGARVFLEAADQNDFKLVVKCNGQVKYTYKVHQDLQSGSTNRYTHAMMWKGGKDWTLEFPDRSQWVLFKEMHEECHNRNIRAASIKNIPIPGVRLIEDSGDEQERTTFVRSRGYFRQVKNDVEMAMDGSRVLYDMDSEDEKWVRSTCEGSEDDMISDELFEKVMDMFEKVSYAQKRDHFTSEEIEELIAKVSPLQEAKSIYDHWRDKRQRKGMPLVRQLQPPLWEKYQQTCREWNQSKPRPIAGGNSGSQGKASACDKPPMFAFCLKPRGLELLHKGSKHRPHKKISLSGHSHAFLGDHDTHPSSGRRVNGYAFGDDRAESSDVSPQVNKMYSSPREPAHFYLDGAESADWNHQLRIQRNNSRSIRTAASPSIRKAVTRNNGKRQYNTHPEWRSNQPSPRYAHQGQLVLSGSDLDEFRLRDASSAAKHARNMAKLKRERAQKLMLSADLAIHKAVSALMTAEAIKASCTGDGDERTRSTSTTTSTG
ncbi:uncharacterized protein [Rutidosis leptorrhynchoides]|uniref:uncharacterized protein n=1 Tax=Rutidosis leptorrhynchoides TaxID=125765 RepID=UPI003A9A087C